MVNPLVESFPLALQMVDPARIVEADVREDLRAGREPFERIMAARGQVPPDGALVVRATFEPVPLYAVLGRPGWQHHTEELAADDWRVWFYPDRPVPDAPAVAPSTPSSVESRQPPAPPSQTWKDRTMTEAQTLDVRVIPPRDKHPTIFRTFDALAPGESFVLLNDHDPKPLRYQFEAEHAGAFTWNYLESGPAIWRVEIGKSAS